MASAVRHVSLFEVSAEWSELVRLSWGLRSGIFAEDSWGCSVTTTLEAGEQMSSVASDVRGFLHQGEGRRPGGMAVQHLERGPHPHRRLLRPLLRP
ncbi:DUF6228 family protein [Streptomyces globisporus]|uniref:DUF6228 family protein n=1 Tax=Streptomyces globisporus TaxID=1908 RepID=UPI002D21955F|nr:DUF6228 family protein [Streptomyces globisporus]